ncbi:hypothetical protein [Methylobacterium sp. PvR107]|uniref:hypothetical protein n=1 Tax=Methylobacterium sp. PvR107 TaxID=2806597 RepID=UPI001B7CACB1|nr:hypothetical protein [Methylobacterium sp. PvR107]MBP1182046.1 hypothetical protein [Methylobacterium sp. PvR107]
MKVASATTPAISQGLWPPGALPEEGLSEEGLSEEGLSEEGLPEEGLPEEGLPEELLPAFGFRPGAADPPLGAIALTGP